MFADCPVKFENLVLQAVPGNFLLMRWALFAQYLTARNALYF